METPSRRQERHKEHHVVERTDYREGQRRKREQLHIVDFKKRDSPKRQRRIEDSYPSAPDMALAPPVKRRRKISREEALRKRMLRKRRQMKYKMIAFSLMFIILAVGILLIFNFLKKEDKSMEKEVKEAFKEVTAPVMKKNIDERKPLLTEDFLTVNEYSRPGELLPEVKNIFVHYTANPNTTAQQNRSYFQSLMSTHITSASAHFIIGYDGDIIQCLPLDEIGYAVMGRNYDSISIECCYLAENGEFTDATKESLIKLLVWLLDRYELDTGDILRHYDEGGKACPKYYVENEDEWEKLKWNVKKAM